MNTASLRLIRNILLRTALLSFVLTLLAALITVGLWDNVSAMTCTWYHTTPEAFGAVVLNYFALVKFYYLFVLLVPALALHWTIKVQERNG